MIEMREAGSLSEVHSFPTSKSRTTFRNRNNHTGIEPKRIKHFNYQIDRMDYRLGYWVKDESTGRWLLEGVTRKATEGVVVPINLYQEEKERKHG
jgi:hypothetical protein